MGPNAAIGGNAAIRVCFKQGTTDANLGVAPYPPLPDKASAAAPTAPPGIYYGTGGTFPSFGLDLSNRIIVPIVMNAKSLFARGIVNPGNGQPGTTCDELVGATADAAAGLVANQDYWELPKIDAGTFLREKAYVLLLTGCVGDSPIVNGAKCGPGFTPGGGPGVGNLKVQIFETTRTPVSATALGVQFLHGSPQAQAIFGAVGLTTFVPGFDKDPTDAGGFKAVVPEAGVAYPSLSPAVGVTGTADTDYFALGETNPLNPPAALLPYPLTTIQALSGLGLPAAPTIYKDGKNFVFIAVGDPEQAETPPYVFPDGGPAPAEPQNFNTKFFHFLAFPTDPTVVPYMP
jgi:hypothetical protein